MSVVNQPVITIGVSARASALLPMLAAVDAYLAMHEADVANVAGDRFARRVRQFLDATRLQITKFSPSLERSLWSYADALFTASDVIEDRSVETAQVVKAIALALIDIRFEAQRESEVPRD